MSSSKETGGEQVIYSLCSGYNFYYLDKDGEGEVFGKKKKIVRHVKTGELFYLTDFPRHLSSGVSAADWETKLGDWVSMLRAPVDLKHFIWPVDMVSWKDGDKLRFSLVFPLRALPVLNDLTNKLDEEPFEAGLEFDWIKKVASELLDAFGNLSSNGYTYHEFSKGNMFYIPNKYDLLFDFSFSTRRCSGIYEPEFIQSRSITPDYADPYYYSPRSRSCMDMASDYYTVAVLLFKLLTGILPYQGAIIKHEPNSTEQEHASWIKLYHENTVFVFDRDDASNHIGGVTGFASDEVYVERWNALPKHVRNMFHNVFQTANVQRTASQLFFYTPAQWKTALFGGGVEMVGTPLVYRAYEAMD